MKKKYLKSAVMLFTKQTAIGPYTGLSNEMQLKGMQNLWVPKFGFEATFY